MKKGDKVIIKHNKSICTVVSVHRHSVEVTSELWLGTYLLRYEELKLVNASNKIGYLPTSKLISDDLLRLIEFGTGENKVKK